jgi:hypothetical protein
MKTIVPGQKIREPIALVRGFAGLLGALLPFYRVDAKVSIGAVDLARSSVWRPTDQFRPTAMRS